MSQLTSGNYDLMIDTCTEIAGGSSSSCCPTAQHSSPAWFPVMRRARGEEREKSQGIRLHCIVAGREGWEPLAVKSACVYL